MSHTQNKTEQSGAIRYGKAMLFGLLFGVVALLGSYIVFAIAASIADLPSVVLTGMVMIGIILAGFVSGYCAAKLIGCRGLIVGLIHGIIAAFLFMLFSLTVFSCGFTVMLGIKLALLIFFSVCGGIFGVNRKKRHK